MIRAGEREELHASSMAKLRKEKVRRARRRRERGRWRARERGVVDLESLDGRETGIGLHDGNDTAMGASGGVSAITATCITGGREVGV